MTALTEIISSAYFVAQMLDMEAKGKTDVSSNLLKRMANLLREDATAVVDQLARKNGWTDVAKENG